MKRILPAVLTVLLLLSGCGGSGAEQNSYRQITQEEAKQMMDEREDAVVLDVRERDEYDAGHIPGAVLLAGAASLLLYRDKRRKEGGRTDSRMT